MAEIGQTNVRTKLKSLRKRRGRKLDRSRLNTIRGWKRDRRSRLKKLTGKIGISERLTDHATF